MEKKTYEDVKALFEEIPGHDEATARLDREIEILTKDFVKQGLSEKEAVFHAASIVLNSDHQPGDTYVIEGMDDDEGE